MHFNKFYRTFFNLCNQISGFLPLLFWILLIYGFADSESATITVLAALIHECGHELYIFLSRGGTFHLRSSLSGFRIKKGLHSSYLFDTGLYAAGPMANLISVILVLLFPLSPDYKSLFAAIGLATAISNLLPIEGYDGYGILSSLIKHFGKEERYLPVLQNLSFFLLIILTWLSLYIVGKIGDSFWMAGLFLISLVGEVSKRMKYIFSENSGDLERKNEI